MFLTPDRLIGIFLLFTFIGTHTPLAAAAAGLTVDNPRIRELIPGQNKTAAYFDITNEGATEVALVGIVSDTVGAIEIHAIVRDGDTVRMRQLTEVVLPPGKTVRFRPGDLHLMLFEVTDLPTETEIQLLTSDGGVHRSMFRRISLLESVEDD